MIIRLEEQSNGKLDKVVALRVKNKFKNINKCFEVRWLNRKKAWWLIWYYHQSEQIRQKINGFSDMGNGCNFQREEEVQREANQKDSK